MFILQYNITTTKQSNLKLNTIEKYVFNVIWLERKCKDRL